MKFIAVTSSADGWLISATSGLGPPFNLDTPKFQLRYTSDWQPESLAIEATVSGQLLTLSTTFTRTTAVSELMQGGQPTNAQPCRVAANAGHAQQLLRAVRGVARRLGSAAVGAKFPVYVAPQAEVSMTVTKITPHRVTTPRARLTFGSST